LLVGLAIGAVLGLIGAGGAVVAVPAFLYLFDFSPLAATTASLAVVAASATAGAIPRLRLGQVRIKQALTFWGLGIVGILVGAFLAPVIPELVLLSGFAVIMVGAAIAMWRKSSSTELVEVPQRAAWLLPVVALGIGLLTGLFGVGGGFLIVPALVLVFGLRFGLATGTSLVVVALNSLTALIFKFDTWEKVDWQIPALVVVGGLVGSVVASRWKVGIPRRILERGFAVLLMILVVWMVLQPFVLPK
jgi:uncharacterized membrane protein YfcA